MTQDEVAASYNDLIGDPQASMSGKRISDFEAWPIGGVKPTLHTLSVLARLYGTKPNLLVDFTDYEAMSLTERAALRAYESNAGPEAPANSPMTVAGIDEFADVASGWSAYLRCCLAIVERSTYFSEEVDELLAVLNRVIATLVCREAAWLDVVVPVHSVSPAAVPLVEGLVSELGWLQVWASGVRRTTRPTLIPVQVNGIPWRGSGNAYLSRGIDYVGSFRGLYADPEYGLAPGLLSKIEARYRYWRDECYFGALLAVAIRTPEPGGSDALGVLNVNFRCENPIGENDTIDPQRSIAVMDILEPALRLIAVAIQKHHLPRSGQS
ncbi:hypothetical protein [Nocardia sp. NPDC127526]|uniref:hypothetical protein n=1 Tax=Nocardia sp. NPDC127526 TaxID=3345393 RepID=UPI003645C3A4